MLRVTMRALPFAYGEGKLLELVSAYRTRLRTCVERVDLHEPLSRPFRLVVEHSAERTPSCVGDRLRKMTVLLHVLDFQTLRANRLVFVDQTLQR